MWKSQSANGILNARCHKLLRGTERPEFLYDIPTWRCSFILVFAFAFNLRPRGHRESAAHILGLSGKCRWVLQFALDFSLEKLWRLASVTSYNERPLDFETYCRISMIQEIFHLEFRFRKHLLENLAHCRHMAQIMPLQ